MPTATPTDQAEGERVFGAAAELFSLLSTPIRLRIISATCETERNVNEILAQVGGTQSNLSQHLAVLYRSGVLSRRKQGTTVFYQVQSERVAMLCRSVCTQIALELDEPQATERSQRLASNAFH
jgi:DNA-binding transcriptional ArsR family regulator